jgi:hypothetical protein
MSYAPGDRQSVTRFTAAQLAELWEDDDDDANEYEPASEMSEETLGAEDDESEENDYLGMERAFDTITHILTVTDAEDGLSGVDIEISIETDPDATGNGEDDEGERTETEGADRRNNATIGGLIPLPCQEHPNNSRSHPCPD